MRVCVVSPSPGYRKSAGARIRYLRLAPILAALGHALDIEPIESFAAGTKRGADIYLLSKCYDARGLALARVLRGEGKRVGVDFFDDTFSQHDDARLASYRRWMREMAPFVDFAVCSTARMQDVVRRHWGDVPTHLLNDPYETLDLTSVVERVEAKLDRVRRTGRLEVAWFGQGDNHHFPVGLRDIVAFGHVLRDLAEAFQIHLSVLTNERALSPRGLERVGELPVSLSIAQWSEQRESEMLRTCPVVFLPVNGQPFSVAKSLNRCVTALSGGAQVLSAGYPLYSAFDAFIYREAATLARDIHADTPALGRATAVQFAERLSAFGDPAVEASRLATFLSGLALRTSSSRSDEAAIGVIHGRDSTNDAHRSAQKLGQLSIASPFARTGRAYDVELRREEGTRVLASLSARAVGRLDPELRSRVDLQEPDQGGALLVTEHVGSALRLSLEGGETRTLPATLAEYAPAMSDLIRLCERLFPGTLLLISELDPLLNAALGDRMAGAYA